MVHSTGDNQRESNVSIRTFQYALSLIQEFESNGSHSRHDSLTDLNLYSNPDGVRFHDTNLILLSKAYDSGYYLLSVMGLGDMKSGIFAVINIGTLRLYIGETHHLKQRWEPILQQLTQGCCKHVALQAEWDKEQGNRKVTFHTASELKHETTLIRYKVLLRDLSDGNVASKAP